MLVFAEPVTSYNSCDRGEPGCLSVGRFMKGCKAGPTEIHNLEARKCVRAMDNGTADHSMLKATCATDGSITVLEYARTNNCSGKPSGAHAFKLNASCSSKYPVKTVGCKARPPFKAKLGAKNGVPARSYSFRYARPSSDSGNYSSIMIAECKKFGMKPVCEYDYYCKNDKSSLYIGQSGLLTSSRGNSYAPAGFSKISTHWSGLCGYGGSPRGSNFRAICNVPSNTANWKLPSSKRLGFICGAGFVPTRSPTSKGQTWAPTRNPTSAPTFAPFKATLSSRNGVSANSYTFRRLGPSSSNSGNFSSIMIKECKKYGMKPVCGEGLVESKTAGAL